MRKLIINKKLKNTKKTIREIEEEILDFIVEYDSNNIDDDYIKKLHNIFKLSNDDKNLFLLYYELKSFKKIVEECNLKYFTIYQRISNIKKELNK